MLHEYLQALHRFPLLTAQQEIELARQIQAARNTPESDPLYRGMQRRAMRARRRFIECNLRLVVNIAKKRSQCRQGLEMMDLIQEGNIGLARAVDKFDPTLGYRFSTYAFWWIRQQIQGAIQSSDAMIRLPVSAQAVIYRVGKIAADLEVSGGHKPTLQELADAADISLSDLALYLSRQRPVSSLDAPVQQSDGFTDRAGLIADPSTIDADSWSDAMDDAAKVAALHEFMGNGLSPLARDVIMARHCEMPEPWDEIQARTGISGSNLREIERRGLKRCRTMSPAPASPLLGQDLGMVATEQLSLLGV